MTNFTIKRPFGPPMYYTMLDYAFINMLQEIAKETRKKNINIGRKLAGNIAHQYQAEMNNLQHEIFVKTLYPHICNTVKEFGELSLQNNSKLRFNFGGGAWINFQQAGEFNPYHSHSGQLSAVIYIDVPEAIREENDTGTVETNMPSAGMINFLYGSDGYGTQSSYRHQAKTGEMFIFPASLKHLVYPFKSNVERISMSFNIYDIIEQ